jgi:Ca2+-binding RTX toxin-like protein
VDARETFSFDFTSFLDVEATTSNPNSEFAQALGESTFVLLNANTENIVDFFTVSGGVVTTENNDFFLLNHTDNVTLNTNESDFDFGSNSEFISGLYQGSYEYTPNRQTDLVLVELNTSFVNLSGDFLINNLGNGVTYGTLNDDTINGNSSNNTIYASLGDDFVRGNDGNDTIEGGYGNDILRGNRGNDRLGGALGDDELYGGTNDDILLGGYGNDFLKGNWGNDTLNGEEGDDIVNGGEGDDILYGDGDILLNTNVTSAGDSINVGQGDDSIDRQINGDILIGGGADTFVFDYDANYGGDYDIIKDFQAGVDKVQFEDASNIDNQAWYNQGINSGNISNNQNGVLIRFTNNNRILLEDISLNELSSSDFIFS